MREPGTTTYLRAVAALCTTRVLVPVVATATRVGTTAGGLASDKEADMAVVMLEAADGRRALLAFTGLDALKAWRADARPVPVTLDLAAQTARAEAVAPSSSTSPDRTRWPSRARSSTRSPSGTGWSRLEPGEFGWAVPGGRRRVGLARLPAGIRRSPALCCVGGRRERARSPSPVIASVPTDLASAPDPQAET